MPHKIHTRKFDRAVKHIKTKGGVNNPYAVAMDALGRDKAVLKSHRRKKLYKKK